MQYPTQTPPIRARALGCMALLGLGLFSNTLQAERSSENYSVEPETFDAGGGHASSGLYSNDGSLGGLGGLAISTNDGLSLASGFIAELPDAATAVIYQTIVGGSFTYVFPGAKPGHTFQASNLPLGIRISRSTGTLSGMPLRPGNYTAVLSSYLKGKLDSQATCSIKVLPLSQGVTGTFFGTLEREQVLNSNLGGALQLSATATGACTGRLTVGNSAVAWKGQLTADPSSPETAALSVPIPQVGKNALLNVVFDGATRTLSGSLSAAGRTSGVQGWLTPWSASNKPKPYTGLHSFYLDQPDPSASLPQGYGFGSLRVAPTTGASTVLATLADGAKTASSSPLGEDGETVLYAVLSGGKGSLLGTASVAAGTDAPANNSLRGAGTWLKAAAVQGVSGSAYAGGFGPAAVSLLGGFYAGISPGSRVMGLPASANNARIRFSDGGLETESREFERRATVANPDATGTTNRVVVAPGTIAVVLPVLNTATGAFAGSATVPGSLSSGTRSATFQGQLVNTGTGTQGYGFFLLPKIPTGSETLRTAPKLSGKVVFEAPSP